MLSKALFAETSDGLTLDSFFTFLKNPFGNPREGPTRYRPMDTSKPTSIMSALTAPIGDGINYFDQVMKNPRILTRVSPQVVGRFQTPNRAAVMLNKAVPANNLDNLLDPANWIKSICKNYCAFSCEKSLSFMWSFNDWKFGSHFWHFVEVDFAC